jgi:para-aminobenzoate synthetase component 1
MQGISPPGYSDEPGLYAALFDCIVIHDYLSGETIFEGSPEKIGELETSLRHADPTPAGDSPNIKPVTPRSNFSRARYIEAVREIQEAIRRGDTYQTNLTQQITVYLSSELSAEIIFSRLRRHNPAAFSAFIQRGDSAVVSTSPERLLRVGGEEITTSPIKGTRRRGATRDEDERLRNELSRSSKDRAENIMIVDLMRNDLGRVCKFGSVHVENICEIEEHPTLFHLVSTVSGEIRPGTSLSDVIRATFPSGSITGAPKMRTMEIISATEPGPRGLSMGAVGVLIPKGFQNRTERLLDLSVAIRTMVVSGDKVVFNVGGGVVIESDPSAEYDESMLKAKALLNALTHASAGARSVADAAFRDHR